MRSRAVRCACWSRRRRAENQATHGKGQEHWFKISTAGTLNIKFDMGTATAGVWSVYRYDPNMAVLSGRNITPSDGSPFNYTLTIFTPGTQYLRVQATAPSLYDGGPYSVTVTPAP